MSATPTKKIVLAVTGSIAAYRACELTRSLVKAGLPVRVMMSSCAENFIGRVTFEALSEREVYTNDWSRGMLHMDIKHEAAVFAVVPTTANMIGKFANGMADDVVSASYLAVECPVWIAPAMNPIMYASRPVQRNLKQLREDGVNIFEPVEGKVVDGDTGIGKLAPLETIAAKLQEIYLSATGENRVV